MNQIPYLGANGYVPSIKSSNDVFPIWAIVLAVICAIVISIYIIKVHIIDDLKLAPNLDSPKSNNDGSQNFNRLI
jgi:hypothetical protein